MSLANAAKFLALPPRQRRIADLEAALAEGQFSAMDLTQAIENRKELLPEEVVETTYVLNSPCTPVEAAGALMGIPLSIKDLFDVKGEQTRAGSVVLDEAEVAHQDAPAVARLRAAGAMLAGRTNMTEFAFSGLGFNPHYGTPRNPLDCERITGGSSSGAAASVGFGLALAALGSDTGGSLRIPAAFCGLVGFKPSQASVPGSGAYPLSPSLDCVGPMAASVDCVSRVWSVLARNQFKLSPTQRPLKLLVPEGPLLDAMTAEVAEAFSQACARLKALGYQLERRRLAVIDEVYAINQAGGLVVPEAAALHKELLEQAGDRYDPFVLNRLTGGMEVPAWSYLQRIYPRPRLQLNFSAEISGFDGVLLPTVPMLAPKREALLQDDAAMREANRLALHNTNIFNYLDAAAISVPFHGDGMDMPIGMMLARPQGEDEALLNNAGALESALMR